MIKKLTKTQFAAVVSQISFMSQYANDTAEQQDFAKEYNKAIIRGLFFANLITIEQHSKLFEIYHDACSKFNMPNSSAEVTGA